MSSLSSPHRAELDAIGRDTGFGADAVAAMYDRIVAGGGRMAQFDHPEFGGAGQRMQGGMTMLGDASNDVLHDRVRRLCDALAAVASQAPSDASSDWRQGGSQLSGGTSSREDPEHLADADGERSRAAPGGRHAPASWYPATLGRPDSSGTQNHARYAWFASTRRLAIDDGGRVTIYDTGDHRIGGVSQQQGAERLIAFTSQLGLVDLHRLPVVSQRDAGDDQTSHAQADPEANVDRHPAMAACPARPPASDAGPADRAGDPFEALEKLADLHRRGIVDDDDYRTKKAELLARI